MPAPPGLGERAAPFDAAGGPSPGASCATDPSGLPPADTPAKTPAEPRAAPCAGGGRAATTQAPDALPPDALPPDALQPDALQSDGPQAHGAAPPAPRPIAAPVAPGPAARAAIGAGLHAPARGLLAGRAPLGVSLRRSPLARRIVGYNLVALALLVAGVLHIDPFRDGLVIERERALVTEARLVASAIEARLAAAGSRAPPEALADALQGLALPGEVELRLFDRAGALVAASSGPAASSLAQPETGSGTGPSTGPSTRPAIEAPPRGLVVTDALDALRAALAGQAPPPAATSGGGAEADGAHAAMVAGALAGRVTTEVAAGAGGPTFRVAVPILGPIPPGGQPAGALVLASASGVLDELARAEREAVLRLFALAIALSIGLGLALASTIAGPLSDLAHAAEAGRGGSAAKVRIPDLTARGDEIGRLSGALRGLVAALVERVDAEERFAADVSHEIKNPLASLGSAVSALRAARPHQRERLLGVIEHDLRRLDRLVSDISNVSRLDSELVREAEAPFDLVRLLAGLAEHLSHAAAERGVALSADLPPGPLVVRGLEARLAQVFVNLIDNAVSFCGPGGGVRIWARRRSGRVLVVVEDTGPGIPEAALARVFERFYSERPEGQFGNNSGLGLAISKQIVEAHGGVIWAENIRGDADVAPQGGHPEAPPATPCAAGSEVAHDGSPHASPGAPADPSPGPPLGARLIVALPA